VRKPINPRQLFAIFVLMGVSASLIPAAIPMVAVELGVSSFDLLPAVPALFGGLFIAVALAPKIVGQFGIGVTLRVASLITALALAFSYFAASPELYIASAVALGLGFGFLEVGATSAARLDSEDTSRLLTKLNIAFTLSAMSAPLVLALEAQLFSSRLIFLVAGALAGILVVAIGATQTAIAQTLRRVEFARGPLLAFMALAALYVGAESILAGWAAAIVFELTALSAGAAAIGSSAFWGLLALGRLSHVWLSKRFLTSRTATVIWPTLAAGAMLMSWVSITASNNAASLVGFGLATFAAGPIYSLIIGAALDAYEQTSAVGLTSVLIFSGAAGGFLLPALLQLSPNISSAALFAGLGFAATAAASVVIRIRADRRSDSKEPSWV